MKKIFLIPLLACFSCVMAWATDAHVSSIADLNAKLADASIETIYLDNDVTYATNETVIWVKRSVTIDGQNHTISGYGKRGARFVTISIYPDEGTYTDPLNVTLKNIKASHNAATGRSLELFHYDSNVELNIDNCEFRLTGSGNNQGVTVESTHTTIFNISNSTFYANNSGYPVITFSPLTFNLSNSTFAGYCGLYFKNGSRGSVVNADACNFDAPNVHSGASNAFAVFALEDGDMTFNLNNCGMNAEQFGDQHQSLFCLSEWTLDENRGIGAINITLSGDNSHFNSSANILDNSYVIPNPDGDPQYGPASDGYLVPMTESDAIHMNVSFTITGGTYSVNPENLFFKNDFYLTKDEEEWVEHYNSVPFTILPTDTVQEINQGGVTLYRVVKKAAEKAPGVMYDLNDLVAGEGVANGNNPVSSFDLSTGTDMTLNQETTTAGYVQVSDKDNGVDPSTPTTVTIGTPSQDQTLVINNGLDVQGESQVIVEAGSTLQIGEGGINTEKPENIVIGADENGAASLIMDPTITVNQTPNLTVKMKAKSIGWMMNGASAKEYYWHRFALPIQQASTWVKNPNKSTYVFGWNYSNDNWEQLSALTQMVPFKGYTLSADYENLGDVEYTFTGQLAGNTNNLLEFERNGFNFFGNSYTGYIDILALVEQIMGDNKIDGSVWVWGDDQNYHVVPLLTLRDGGDVYATEIAPMQTFILKQNGSENASAELNYASAVWGNPRYGHSVTPAPSRNIADETTRMRIIVTAENGKSDFVMFTENAKFSDSFEKGYDGEKYMNENALNMFATVNGTNYTAIATDNLEGKMITINTIEAVNYTMSFAKVNGEEYAIRDNATGKVIAIQEGATYEFAAQPNSTVEGRFQIVMRDKVTTAIENTEVKANVKGIYTLMGQYVGEDFNTLPAGVYVVDGVKIVK